MNEPHGTRPYLFKVRRLIKDYDGTSQYEFLTYNGDNEIGWTELQMDGFAFMDYKKAQEVCEMVKSGKLRHPDAIYHSVIPVGG